MRRTHGLSKTTEHVVWAGMKTRCNNPNDPEYKNYGGRGIRVCPEWQRDFTAFLRDVGPRPSRLHTLDRRDNDGNYEPTNCRWATKKEQAANTRIAVKLTRGTETLTLAEWSRRIGITSAGIARRLKKGWSVEQALSPERSHRWTSPLLKEPNSFVLVCGQCRAAITKKRSEIQSAVSFCSLSCSMTYRNNAAARLGVPWRKGGAQLLTHPSA